MGGFERVTQAPAHRSKYRLQPWHTGVGALSVFIIAQGLGLPDEFLSVLIWYAVAPPIASTIWMCLLLGFRPVLAMELVVMTSLLAPFTGPFLGNLFLTDVVPLNSFDLFVRLALMIIGGAGLAILGQLALGRQRITRNETAFDGLSTVAMLLFLIPGL